MKSLFQFVRRNLDRRPSGLILAYHRVARLASDPWAIAVSPEHFIEHLEILHRECTPMSLERCVLLAAEDKLPPRAVAVTFDDGYADNLHEALPCLHRYGIPASVFVTARAVGSVNEFWWDELERLLLPSTQYSSWRAWEDPLSQRHRLYQVLYAALQKCSERTRSHAFDELQREWGPSNSRTSHQTLTRHELQALAEDPLIEIGAHTLSHPVLSALAPEVQQYEIAGGKSELEAMLGREIRPFAYPYGRAGHYSAETVALVREAGYRIACSFQPGRLDRTSNAFELPRCGVSDWNGDEPHKQLHRWFQN